MRPRGMDVTLVSELWRDGLPLHTCKFFEEALLSSLRRYGGWSRTVRDPSFATFRDIGHPDSESKLCNVFTLKCAFKEPSDIVDLLAKMFRQFPRHRISDLLFVDFSGCGRNLVAHLVWGKLFWEMRGVRRLEIANISLRASNVWFTLLPLSISRMVTPDATVPLLWEPGLTEPSLGIRLTIFPALQTVILSDVKLDRRRKDLAREFFEMVATNMEWRNERGYRLQELVIRDQDGSVDELLDDEEIKAVVKRLEEAVAKVDIVSGKRSND